MRRCQNSANSAFRKIGRSVKRTQVEERRMDRTIAIIVAAISFLGVFVGSIITGGITAYTSYIVAGRQEAAQAEKDSRARGNELTTAARLIGAELLLAETAAKICVEKKRWWSPDVKLTMEAWQKYRSVIAAELPYTDWNAVVIAFVAVDNLMAVVGDSRPTGELTDTTTEKIAPILRDMDRGLLALTPHAVDIPRPRLTSQPQSGK
jgi:hypothetical protein